MDDQSGLDDIDKLWSDLFDGVLDAPQRQAVLSKVASDLNKAVIRGPDSANLMETLRQVFGGRSLTADMWLSAERALSMAYGPAAVRLISWLIDDLDQTEPRLGEITSMLEVRSESLLREILARHAEDLAWSNYAWNNSAQEWRTINIDVTQSLDGRNYFLRLMVLKVNGETVAFESRSNQLLLFTRAILDTLNALPANAFTQSQTIESFLEQAQRMVDTLSASPTATQKDAVNTADGLTPVEASGSPNDDATKK